LSARTTTRLAHALFALSALSCSPANVGGPLADAGPDSGLDASTDGGTSAEQACLDRAYAYCTQLQRCSTTAIVIRFGDVQTCKKYVEGECVGALTAPSSSGTVAQTEACAAAEPSWGCNDILYNQNIPPPCVQPAGPLANGSPCTVNQQCQTLWCARATGEACGACAVPPLSGDPCGGGSCPSPLVCSSASICVAYVEMGNQCSPTSPCDSGLTCVGGICEAGVTTINSPCAAGGPGCDMFSGLACNAQSGSCKTLLLVGGGEACGEVENQPNTCIMGVCLRGACVSYAALGEACDVDTGPACAPILRCILTADGGTAGACQITGTGSCP
jgi:hypothetical protein